MDGSVLFAVRTVQVGVGLTLLISTSIFLAQKWGAPWIITPRLKVKRMLELASPQPGEKLVDLGAGDGRIVIAAAREYGLDAVGVEIDPLRWLLANLFILWFRPRPRPRVVWGDMYKYDISDAQVVTIYLTRTANDRLREKFEQELKPGARVASYAFPISGWTPILIDDHNLIFVYQVGETGEDTQYEFV